jgi:hypothetical protein
MGASSMSCIIGLSHQSAEQVSNQSDGSSIPKIAIDSRVIGSKTPYMAMHMMKHEKELASKQACDASGNLYHKFYYQDLKARASKNH